MSPILFLDYAGVALFAATGALAASRKQLDIIGFLFLGAVTGIGGGTARDLILGVPVFWVEQHIYILVCAGVAIIVYFTAHLIESRYRMLLWLDAVALSAYGVFGAYKGLMVTGSPTVAVIMGMMTGTLGGILRDVLTHEPSVLMRQEIYVAAAMAGAAAFVTAQSAGLPLMAAVGAGFLLALGVRSGALYFGWTFPPYKSRPGRKLNDRP
ncbi:MAG: trimeric intracellular cation channel family protein [Rhodomicrobiaceae bacterium]